MLNWLQVSFLSSRMELTQFELTINTCNLHSNTKSFLYDHPRFTPSNVLATKFRDRNQKRHYLRRAPRPPWPLTRIPPPNNRSNNHLYSSVTISTALLLFSERTHPNYTHDYHQSCKKADPPPDPPVTAPCPWSFLGLLRQLHTMKGAIGLLRGLLSGLLSRLPNRLLSWLYIRLRCGRRRGGAFRRRGLAGLAGLVEAGRLF